MLRNFPVNQLEQYLEFAGRLAREAGKVTLQYYHRELVIEQKTDASPVTIADRETEQFIRAEIRERYPDHGILGEEFGEENPGATWRWIIDPIDGTQAFIHGVPLYTVLLALEYEGNAVLGVIHNPPQDETVAAATGMGCRYNGLPCHVSRTDELRKAWAQVTDYADLKLRRPKFCGELLSRVGYSRSWADAYGYLMVATGRADIMIDPIMSPWDIAPLKTIIIEAGGRITDLDGNSAIAADNTLATNGLLHEQVLEIVKLDGLA